MLKVERFSSRSCSCDPLGKLGLCVQIWKRQGTSKSLLRKTKRYGAERSFGVNECDERGKGEQGVREQNGVRRRGR